MKDFTGKKQRQLLLQSDLKNNSETGKLASMAKFQSLKYSGYVVLWIDEVQDTERVDDFMYPSFVAERPNSGLRESWFQDCKRTNENPTRKHQKIIQHKRKESSVEEELFYGHSDCFEDPRHLQNKWRQWNHFRLHVFFIFFENLNIHILFKKWHEVLSADIDSPTDSILESLLQMRVENSAEFKNFMQVYDQETLFNNKNYDYCSARCWWSKDISKTDLR